MDNAFARQRPARGRRCQAGTLLLLLLLLHHHLSLSPPITLPAQDPKGARDLALIFPYPRRSLSPHRTPRALKNLVPCPSSDCSTSRGTGWRPASARTVWHRPSKRSPRRRRRCCICRRGKASPQTCQRCGVRSRRRSGQDRGQKTAAQLNTRPSRATSTFHLLTWWMQTAMSMLVSLQKSADHPVAGTALLEQINFFGMCV
jgi:hypothetical protein